MHLSENQKERETHRYASHSHRKRVNLGRFTISSPHVFPFAISHFLKVSQETATSNHYKPFSSV